MQRRGELALLILLGLYFFVFGNWVLSLTSPDEGRNAYAALHMLQTGDFIVPYYNCHYRFAKPPLLYWLTALSFKIFGVNEFAARLPSGLAAIGTSLVVYKLTKDFINPKKAFIGASVFLLLIHTWVESRALVPEMVLVFFSTLGVYLFLKGKTLWGWASLALAFLTKGPVGVGLPLLVYLFWKLAELRDLRKTLKGFLRIFDPKGVLLFLVLGFWWYGVMIYRFGWSYFYDFFIWENLGRLTGKLSEHNYPFWYYVPVLLVSVLLFVPAMVKHFRKLFGRITPEGAWFFTVFTFYSLAKSKLHHYILFSYGGLSLLLSRVLSFDYLKIAYPIGGFLLLGLLYFAHLYEEQRFTPKAVKLLREIKPKHLYFYGVENSALVFYLNRCIPFLENPQRVKKGSYVITTEGDLKDFRVPYEVLIKGREFNRMEVLIRIEKETP